MTLSDELAMRIQPGTVIVVALLLIAALAVLVWFGVTLFWIQAWK